MGLFVALCDQNVTRGFSLGKLAEWGVQIMRLRLLRNEIGSHKSFSETTGLIGFHPEISQLGLQVNAAFEDPWIWIDNRF